MQAERVCCARHPEFVYPHFAKAQAPTNGVFKETPPPGTTHYYRGMKDERDLPCLLKERYQIGPHDTDPVAASGYNQTVMGFWFNGGEHEHATGHDEDLYPMASGLTPEHLDFRSKVVMVRRFGLDPTTSAWRPHLGTEWNRAFTELRDNPAVSTMLQAEDLLGGLGVSKDVIFPFLAHLDPKTVIDDLKFIQAQLGALRLTASEEELSPENPKLYSPERPLFEREQQARRFKDEIAITAFLPVPETPGTTVTVNRVNLERVRLLLQELSCKPDQATLYRLLSNNPSLVEFFKSYLEKPEPMLARPGFPLPDAYAFALPVHTYKSNL
ncbi:MAG: hypothetical protein NT099_07790 [Candidatus Saganbacteria bacterium]|nr:hypothetical protein [Candidatus Saganbacteria bacterium]